MRRAAKVDANQAEIVEALRAIGCTVQLLHMVGQGCPDLLVGYRGHNWLLEVKDGNKPPSRRRLTDDEQEWFNEWNGTAVVVNSVEEAIAAVSEPSDFMMATPNELSGYWS
jgi:hypothetical protein